VDAVVEQARLELRQATAPVTQLAWVLRNWQVGRLDCRATYVQQLYDCNSRPF
jgi:hypothetical protein